jgi:hypothetical protein
LRTPKLRASPSAPSELEVMRKLRRVLKRSSAGLGLAGSLVSVFHSSRERTEREAVRRILLGMPVEEALQGFVSGSTSSSELVRFIAALARFNSLEASKGAQRLSAMFDRWTLLKEKRTMEMKVMSFRGTIVSAVAGVVVGMLSTLGPVISSFHISLSATAAAQPPPTVFSTPYEGGFFLLPSAICLGMYLSPERPYLNVIVSLLAFAGVVYFLGPLASFSLGT